LVDSDSSTCWIVGAAVLNLQASGAWQAGILLQSAEDAARMGKIE
jgi:hypothetical protein